MKNKNLLFLTLFLICNLFLLNLVQAQTTYTGSLNNQLTNSVVKSVFNITSPITLGDFIVVLAVFLLIIFSFQDIINTFSLFSEGTTWIIAITMGLIGALTGWFVRFALILVNIFNVLGTLSVFAAVGSAFVVFMGVHLGFTWLGTWMRNRKKMMTLAKNEIKTTAAIKFLKATGEEVTKK